MRPSGMRHRLVASLAVFAFGAAGLGLALVAARSGGGGLPKLPFAAAGAERAAGDAASMSMAVGRVEYRVEGELPDLPEQAPAYRLRKDGGAANARRVAEALGLAGRVEKRDGAWRARSGDQELVVSDQAGLPWHLAEACIEPECTELRTGGGGSVSSGSSQGSTGTAGVGTGAMTATAEARLAPPEPAPPEPAPPQPAPPSHDLPVISCPEPMPPPPPCDDTADCAAPARCGVEPQPLPPPERPADLPDQAGAEHRARQMLDRLGVHVDRLDVSDGITAWWATARIKVGGVPVLGADHMLSIGPKGVIESANGWAGDTDRIGDYPLVGTDAGLDRLRDGVGIGPRPLVDSAVDAGADLADCTKETVICDPPTPVPGGVEPEPHVVTLTGAHLALQLFGDVLVPVYVFEVKDGNGDGPMVPAVVDELLKDMDGPDPARPDPAPGGDGGHGCSAASAVAADGPVGRNAPLVIEVCGPATAKAGEEVVFEVTVTDADAPIYTGTCGGPVVGFGDGPTVSTDCAVACTMAMPADPEKERKPGKHRTAYRHAYEKPGRYTATFEFRSGPCSVWASSGTGEHAIVVK